MFVLRDKLKVRNVVVVVIEVAVMNFVTVGNFAVCIAPNKSMQSDRAKIISSSVSVKIYAVKRFLCVADGFNLRHVAFDLANHLFDGKRFLRCLDALTQEFK